MTTTLRAIRRQMLTLVSDLGRVAPVTALAAQSVTAARLGGGVSGQKWVNHWLLRSEAASAADRNQRFCSSFNGATGAFTHTGDAYVDTTITGENLEVHKYEPALLDQAINAALGKVLYRHRDIIPVRDGVTKHWLSELDWIKHTGDIHEIYWCDSPVLSRNRSMEQWEPDTAGGRTPEWFTLSGTNATVARSTSNLWRGPYVASLTRAGTNCTLRQTVGVLQNGVSARTLRGQTVTAVMPVRCSVANRAAVQIVEDGSVTDGSAYHTGSGKFQILTISVTVAATTDTLSFGALIEDGDTTIEIGELYLVEGALTDTVRLDSFHETLIDPKYDQNSLALINAPMGRSGQFVVYSWRSYPQFDSARVLAGTADADETDAPLLTVACGALAELYRGMGEPAFVYWNDRFEGLQRQGQYVRSERARGANVLPTTLMAPGAARPF